MSYIGKQNGARARGAGYIAVVRAETYDAAADVDLIAVERAVNGEAPQGLNLAEKERAARLLFERRGMSPDRIASHLHTRSDLVWRWVGLPRPRRTAAAQCGTRGGYRRHLRANEPTCQPCRTANAAADRQYRLTGSYRLPVGSEAA